MTAMQKIEAAIGEADAQTVPAPIGETLVEHRPVEHDLVLRRERSGRQDAVAQFGERDRRGAALADHDGGGGIGGAHGGSNGACIASSTAITAATVSPAPDTSRTLTG